MNMHTDRTTERGTRSAANHHSRKQQPADTARQVNDERPQTLVLKQLKALTKDTGRNDLKALRGNVPQPTAATGVQPVIQRVLVGMPAVDTYLVHHLKAGDDPGWMVVAVQERTLTVAKGERRLTIDYPSFDWSTVETAEEGRQLFLKDDKEWSPEQLRQWAMFQYTATKYKAINTIVSGKDEGGQTEKDLDFRFSITPGTPPEMTTRRLILLLRETLHDLPGPAKTVTTLTKGVNLEEHDKIPPRYTVGDHTVGQEFVVEEFTSTSTGNPFTDRDSLIVYEGVDQVPHTGKPVPEGYTPSGNEGEVLFPPGLKYRVEEVADRGTERFGQLLQAHGIMVEPPKLKRIVRVRLLPSNQ
ncbi:hypothetical protein CLV84_4064 [Neolewinella xylanilytica]|uniref:Uncharacterized protein n=1 Tax=Neolewinella xylanilytica TaxID=1514080 RepID=A0A2S6I0K3_9BACT|nr:hypothetical protein [Neolewinella xylanilytica]PPK84295.1 hypothetical protein CLV84_4064 [Neolewinella xylanilytica]